MPKGIIGIKQSDGKIKAITIRWDSDPFFAGKALYEAYNSPDKAAALINMGNIESLNHAVPNRDYQIKDDLKFDNEEQFFNYGYYTEYNYLYDNGWKFNHLQQKEIHDLTPEIMDQFYKTFKEQW